MLVCENCQNKFPFGLTKRKTPQRFCSEICRRKWLGKNNVKRIGYTDLTGKKFNSLVVIEHFKDPYDGRMAMLCLCDCGNRVKVKRGDLTKKPYPTKSCGCQNSAPRPQTRKADGEGSLRGVYNMYRANARKRNLDFNLSYELFRQLILQNCFYCGSQPSKVRKPGGCATPITYNGVDRIDSSLGYEILNCVPCCNQCNVIKSNKSIDTFFTWAINFSKTTLDIKEIANVNQIVNSFNTKRASWLGEVDVR